MLLSVGLFVPEYVTETIPENIPQFLRDDVIFTLDAGADLTTVKACTLTDWAFRWSHRFGSVFFHALYAFKICLASTG
jgi:hypothetical protein